MYRDHYSKDPNAWGRSWGVKAQEELQAKFDRQREEESRAKQAAEQATWEDIEMQRAGSRSSGGDGEGTIEVVKEDATGHGDIVAPAEVKGRSTS